MISMVLACTFIGNQANSSEKAYSKFSNFFCAILNVTMCTFCFVPFIQQSINFLTCALEHLQREERQQQYIRKRTRLCYSHEDTFHQMTRDVYAPTVHCIIILTLEGNFDILCKITWKMQGRNGRPEKVWANTILTESLNEYLTVRHHCEITMS